MNEIHSEIIHLSPDDLTIHPAMEGFPDLSDDQKAALELSIKKHGVQSPVVADAELRVYDGRARMAAALAQGISSIPVWTRPEKDVLSYAIESAVNRRQLTRSAIALVLFEQHPELPRTSKGGRPKKLSLNDSSSPTHDSYRQLAARYRVQHQYFYLLAEMRAEASEEEWAELRRVILFEEASIPRQYAGFRTGLKAGCKRGPVVYAAVDEQGFLEGILPTAFASIRQGFARWNTADIKTEAKAALEKEWGELLDDAPPELLRIAAKKGGRS